MGYRVGEFKERVTIQSKIRTRDEVGGFTESWKDEATVWALVRSMSGKERAFAEQQQSQATYKIVLRYRAINAAQRIVWRGTPFNIRFVADNGPTTAFIEIEAECGVET